MDSDREALLPVMLAPATIYRELLSRPTGELSGWIGERFEILAGPGLMLRHQPRPGDVSQAHIRRWAMRRAHRRP
jgi:hypothetical protein